jgi:hypothetical protein
MPNVSPIHNFLLHKFAPLLIHILLKYDSRIFALLWSSLPHNCSPSPYYHWSNYFWYYLLSLILLVIPRLCKQSFPWKSCANKGTLLLNEERPGHMTVTIRPRLAVALYLMSGLLTCYNVTNMPASHLATNLPLRCFLTLPRPGAKCCVIRPPFFFSFKTCSLIHIEHRKCARSRACPGPVPGPRASAN